MEIAVKMFSAESGLLSTSRSSNRSFNRWLAVLVAIFLTSTIVLAIFLAVNKNKTDDNTSNSTDYCMTPYCIKACESNAFLHSKVVRKTECIL